MGWIKAMGYLGVNAPDLDAWRHFAIDLLGMEEAEAPATADAAENLYLRYDDHAYRIAVMPSHQPGVAYIGWEVSDAATLDALVEHLRSNGYEVTPGSQEDARDRRVGGLIRVDDPAGNSLELFHSPEKAAAPFRSPHDVRFVTGDGGMGHAFLVVPDSTAAKRFYEDVLGFRLSDTIGMPFGEGRFYHTNPRHHSLAFASIPGVPGMMQHLMVEVGDAQAVVDAFDRVVSSGTPISSSLGKHTNDHMFSFYLPTPSGFDIEYGNNGRRIEDDDAWEVGSYTAASFWGHERKDMPQLPPEALAAMAGAGEAQG